jgi:hypothetical protein
MYIDEGTNKPFKNQKSKIKSISTSFFFNDYSLDEV